MPAFLCEKRLSFFAVLVWRMEHLSVNKDHKDWVMDNHREGHQKADYSLTHPESDPYVIFRHEQEIRASSWRAGRE